MTDFLLTLLCVLFLALLCLVMVVGAIGLLAEYVGAEDAFKSWVRRVIFRMER